jgi:hypothetical protein
MESGFRLFLLMDVESSPREYGAQLAPFATAFGLGLILMGYSTMTYWQSAYMAVNPTIGSVSTSLAGVVFYIGLFLIGAMITFTAFMTALYKVIQDSDI